LTTNKIYKDDLVINYKMVNDALKNPNRKYVGWAAFFLILATLIAISMAPTGIGEVIKPWTGIVIGILFLLIGFLSLTNILKISKFYGFLSVIVGIIFILFVIAIDIIEPLLEFLRILSGIPLLIPILILLSGILAIKGGNLVTKIAAIAVLAYGIANFIFYINLDLFSLPEAIMSVVDSVLSYEWWNLILTICVIIFLYNSSQTAKKYLQGSSQYLKEKYKQTKGWAKQQQEIRLKNES